MQVKCAGPDCNVVFEAPEGDPSVCFFCSIECACYAGRFSVREGWLPKKPVHELTEDERTDIEFSINHVDEAAAAEILGVPLSKENYNG